MDKKMKTGVYEGEIKSNENLEEKKHETEIKITPPLLSLVSLPAFTMDELAVDFDMEVKESKLQ